MKLVFAVTLFLTQLAIADQPEVRVVLGTANDPCVGGSPWTAPGAPIPTLRFGTFSCTVSLPAPAAYIVQLDFIEPSAFVPSTDVFGRLFNVKLSDSLDIVTYGRMDNVDLFTMLQSSATNVISQTFLVFTYDGKIKVTLTTVKRSAVLSQIVISSPIFIGNIFEFDKVMQ